MDESNLVGDQLDIVKRQIYSYWATASRFRREIHKQKVQVPDQDSFRGTADFQSAVLELYYACEPKLQYHKNTACVESINKLKPMIEPSHKFSLQVAEALFRLLTEFLELDGVTKFEEEKHVAKPY